MMILSNLPPNMTEGCDVKYIGDRDKLGLSKDCPVKTMRKCFAYVEEKANDIGVLIVVDEDMFLMEEYLTKKFADNKLRYCVERIIGCSCKRRIWSLLIGYLLKEVGREAPVFHMGNFSTGRNDVKKYIAKPGRRQDLVVSYKLVKGYEAEFIINVSNRKEFMSRSFGNVVDLKFDFYLGLCLVVDAILNEAVIIDDKKYHDCAKELDRRKLDFSSKPGTYSYSLPCVLALCLLAHRQK